MVATSGFLKPSYVLPWFFFSVFLFFLVFFTLVPCPRKCLHSAGTYLAKPEGTKEKRWWYNT